MPKDTKIILLNEEPQVAEATNGASPEVKADADLSKKNFKQSDNAFIGAIQEPHQTYLDKIGYVNASSLKPLRISGKQYLYELTREDKTMTESMILGTAVHCLMGETKQDFDERFMLVPKVDRRTNEGKRVWAEFEMASRGKILLNEELNKKARDMFQSAMNKKSVRELIKDGEREKSYYWWDDEFGGDGGLPCKAKPDFVKHSGSCIVDIKTATDVSPAGFSKICAQLGYEIQVNFYQRGVGKVSKKDYREFVFIAIENDEPYDIVLYRTTDEFRNFAKYHTEHLMHKLRKCIDENKFEGVDEVADNDYGLMELNLPTWYSNQLSNLVIPYKP